jgi:hypothetical protein
MSSWKAALPPLFISVPSIVAGNGAYRGKAFNIFSFFFDGQESRSIPIPLPF